jgi:hypothetical protein
MATKKGIQELNPILLEPTGRHRRVPEQYMGDVNRDLNSAAGV